jgi:hypothetical protein
MRNDDGGPASKQEPEFDFDNDPDAYSRATAYYAGPFCSCGDLSCPAMNDAEANCHP